MSVLNYYYLDSENREIGPLPLPALAQLRQAGVLSDDTLVRTENGAEWVKCRSLIVVAAVAPASPGPSRAKTGVGFLQRQSWTVYAIALICFFLPFVTFSCQQKPLLSLSGYQLAFGANVAQANPISGAMETKHIDAEATATVALVFACLGLLAAFIARPESKAVGVVVSGGGVIALLMLKASIERQVSAQGQGGIEFAFEAGYWLTLALLFSGAILHARSFWEAFKHGWRWGKAHSIAIVFLFCLTAVFYLGPEACDRITNRRPTDELLKQRIISGAPFWANNYSVEKMDVSLGTSSSGVAMGSVKLNLRMKGPRYAQVDGGLEAATAALGLDNHAYENALQIASGLPVGVAPTPPTPLLAPFYREVNTSGSSSQLSVSFIATRISSSWSFADRLKAWTQRVPWLVQSVAWPQIMPEELNHLITKDSVIGNGALIDGDERAVATVQRYVIAAQDFIKAVNSARIDAGRGVQREDHVLNRIISLPDIGIDMMPIPAGSFIMGSAESEAGYLRWEGPRHKVTISMPFWPAKYPVTQDQAAALMGIGGPFVFGRPIKGIALNLIKWDDAMAFCKKLTEHERAAHRLPQGYVYILPTEAQWEYACRAGTTGPCYGVLNIWTSHHPPPDFFSGLRVGQREPNPWGLHDMFGTITQWCLDWFGHYPAGAVVDPYVSDSADSVSILGNAEHAVRGTSVSEGEEQARSAHRNMNQPFNGQGFRVALSQWPPNPQVNEADTGKNNIAASTQVAIVPSATAKSSDDLEKAVLSDDTVAIQQLLQKSTDVEDRIKLSQKALLSAAGAGKIAIVRLLLESGVDIEAKDGVGWTALRHATIAGQVGVMRLLLEKGANIEDIDGISHVTALANVLMFPGLFDKKKASTEDDESGTKPARSWLVKETEVVKTLLENGANVEARDSHGDTLLGLAASGANVEVVKLLLEHGANIEAKDTYLQVGTTALQHAADSGNIEIAKLLLEKGANIEAKDNLGNTALLCAINFRKNEMVKFLLENGASPQTR